MRENDVIGAKSLLIGIDEQRKKMVVSKKINGSVPLCVAATYGNTAMVEFLVKDCQANTEEGGDLGTLASMACGKQTHARDG